MNIKFKTHAREFSLLGLLFVCLSMYWPTVLAQTPDGETPANEGVCDSLIGLTPGLYGLCVAFCEAQDCEATLDPITHEVTFDEACGPSNPKLLENYNKRKQPGDRTMPCLNISEPPMPSECICWTEPEMDSIAEMSVTACTDDLISGLNVDGRNEQAHVRKEDKCLVLFWDETGTRINRYLSTTPDERASCQQSIVYECASRGY